MVNFKSTASFIILQQFQHFLSLVFALNRCFRECYSLPSQSHCSNAAKVFKRPAIFEEKSRCILHAPCCKARDFKFCRMQSIAFHRQVYNNNTDIAHSSHSDFRFPFESYARAVSRFEILLSLSN